MAAAMAAAATNKLGALCCTARSSQSNVAAAASVRTGAPRTSSSSAGISFGLVLRKHRAQRLLHFVAEASADPAPAAPKPAPKEPPAKKPSFTMTKGQIVRVDKEKYLNSIEYYAVAHPKFFKGLDYIYEDRGEILDIRFFEAGEYALVQWAGIPTSPAWLPVYMLIKGCQWFPSSDPVKLLDMQSDKLSYKRT